MNSTRSMLPEDWVALERQYEELDVIEIQNIEARIWMRLRSDVRPHGSTGSG
jgi:hypothetical protein